ncbi:MAG: hypothetical protein RJB61_1517, partial [Actinomycetota bacterium]
IDAVHAETEALGTDRVVGDSRQGSSDAGSAFSVSLPVAGVHAEQDSVDSAIPAEGSAPGGPDEYVDTNDDGIAADVVGTVDLTTPLDAATRRSDSVGLEVSAHLVETDGRDDNGAVGNVGLPGDHSAPELVNAVAIRNGDEPVDAIDDGSEADDGTEVDDGSEVDDNDDLDDSGDLDDVDDTWDALRLPVRPLPVDADWDDDLPVSAAASAAERAARMHRVEPPQASPADRAPATPQRAGAPSSRPLDLLAERARQRGDVAGDEGSFRIGGDELH